MLQVRRDALQCIGEVVAELAACLTILGASEDAVGAVVMGCESSLDDALAEFVGHCPALSGDDLAVIAATARDRWPQWVAMGLEPDALEVK